MATTKKAAIKKTAPAVTGEVLARLSPMLTAWSKAEKEAEDQAKITVDVAPAHLISGKWRWGMGGVYASPDCQNWPRLTISLYINGLHLQESL